MKYFFYAIIFLTAVLPVFAYQVGPANRTQFGSNQQAQSAPQYRSFTNYNNHSWGQGVQTRGVQTQVAGSSPTDLSNNQEKSKAIGKQAVSPATTTTTSASSTSSVAGTTPGSVQCEGGKCRGSLNIPANTDPAVAAQQIQNMMQDMKALSGGAQAAAGQNAATMPAGMPDLSALMGGATPAATPAKK